VGCKSLGVKSGSSCGIPIQIRDQAEVGTFLNEVDDGALKRRCRKTFEDSHVGGVEFALSIVEFWALSLSTLRCRELVAISAEVADPM